jgi:hypothetical protein
MEKNMYNYLLSIIVAILLKNSKNIKYDLKIYMLIT